VLETRRRKFDVNVESEYRRGAATEKRSEGARNKKFRGTAVKKRRRHPGLQTFISEEPAKQWEGGWGRRSSRWTATMALFEERGNTRGSGCHEQRTIFKPEARLRALRFSHIAAQIEEEGKD